MALEDRRFHLTKVDLSRYGKRGLTKQLQVIVIIYSMIWCEQ